MRNSLRLGLMAAGVSLIVAAFVLPADAQRPRGGSGSGGGASAQASHPAPPPQQAQSPQGGATVGRAVPRGSSGQARPGGGPPPQAGAPARGGPGAGPRPGGGPGPAGGPVYGPGHGPGRGPGYGPGYGYGYRGYPRYGSSFYFGFGGFYGPYYWSPWFYSPYWYGPWGYDPFYSPAYGYGWGGGYGGYNAANLKVQVEPKNAEVYVDGRLAGIVDHFDGMFQSLMVEGGAHDVVVYLDGYRSIREHLYLNVGSTYRIKGVMEKLAPGEPGEPRPQAAMVMPQRPVQAGPEPPDNYPPPPSSPPEMRGAEPNPPVPPVSGDAKFGQVAIRVQPGDAEVLIDGEPWRSAPGADRLVVHLSPGTHRIEIKKEGFDSFVTAVEIKRGETAVLNVSLTRF